MTANERKMIQRILDKAPLSIDGLADEAGISRHTLHAWASGRRNPTPENIAALADALERRGGELVKLAEQLREEAKEG